MRVDVVALRDWCDQLCRDGATDAREVVVALGLHPQPGADGDLLPVAPPEGASRCTARSSRGRFWELTLAFDGAGIDHDSGIDRHTLEDAMGPGVPLRRTRSRPDHRITYRVVVAGAPFSCDLLATFAEPPSPQSVATAVTLRRSTPVGAG